MNAGRGRPYVWGLAAAAAYVLAVVASRLAGVAPLLPVFDGLAPATPYRWVAPPPEFRAANQPPQSAAAAIALTAQGSDPLSITTTRADCSSTARWIRCPNSPGDSSAGSTG